MQNSTMFTKMENIACQSTSALGSQNGTNNGRMLVSTNKVWVHSVIWVVFDTGEAYAQPPFNVNPNCIETKESNRKPETEDPFYSSKG